jgi:Ca2+-binding RTX toxin-like protein
MRTISFGGNQTAFATFITAQLADITDLTLRQIAISVATGDAQLGSTAGDVLVSGNGNDVTIGDHGNDYMQSGDGSDIYVYARGDGNDWLRDTGLSATDQDKLLLTDIQSSEVSVVRHNSCNQYHWRWVDNR